MKLGNIAPLVPTTSSLHRAKPYAHEIALGHIPRPCQGYPRNADAWVDEPTASGVVLVGNEAARTNIAVWRADRVRQAATQAALRRDHRRSSDATRL